MYFNFIDGGERAYNNTNYYAALGLSTSQINAPITITDINLNGTNTQYFFSFTSNYISTYWKSPNLSSTTIYCGFKMYFGSLSYSSTFAFFNTNNNVQVSVVFNTNGSISVYRGATSTLLGTSASNLFFSQTAFFVEIFCDIDATNGSVIVRLNGNTTPVISLTSINTASDTTSLPITYFGSNSGVSSYYVYWRDIYVHDGTGSAPFNTFLGSGGCVILPPDANNSVSFTAVGNSQNYQNAASEPPNASYYNQSNTVNASDTFALTPIGGNVQSVIGLKLYDYSLKNDSGARSLAKILTSGGTTVVGTINYLAEGALSHEDLYTVDPHTGTAFTSSGINSLSVGYKIIS